MLLHLSTLQAIYLHIARKVEFPAGVGIVYLSPSALRLIVGGILGLLAVKLSSENTERPTITLE